MATTIFGHRGCPAHEPENSPAGFRYALTHGAEGIETDLHLTKDGVPVIIHDETLHRTTNGTGQVADYTLAELRQFRLPNGECIPTLADFLQLVGTAPVQLNLEFKTDVERYPGIEETVLPLVKEAPLAKPVIFSSFWLKDEFSDAGYTNNQIKHMMELAGAKHYFDASSGFLKITVEGGTLLVTISQLIEVITKLDFIRHAEIK